MAAEPQALASGKLLLDHPAEGVVRLRIDHGARRGALDHEILDTLAETVATGLDDARALILTGTGPVFSAGYDLGNLSGETFEHDAEALVAHPFHAAIGALEAFGKPIVGALNGHAIGGGLELALTCDLRIAARGIKVGMPPAKLGLVYSHTGLRKFVDAIGAPRTRELFLRGRNVEVGVALDWGLVNEVVPGASLADAAVAYAAEVAGNAPLSLAGNKRVLRELLAAEGALEPEIQQELIALREACFASEDFSEGVRAFGEKRAPRWRRR